MAGGKFRKLMMVGDSMIEFFDWQDRFPDREVMNLGRSGESVEELRDRAVFIVERNEPPDLVLVMIGTNNVAMENFTFPPVYRGILETFREAYADAALIVNSLLPMNLRYLAPDTVARVNSSLKGLANETGALYLDVWAEMVDRNGTVLDDILEDEVHLTINGYKVWADRLEDFLKSREG